MQTDAIEKPLDQALLDPDLAAQMLNEGNPAKRAALARKAKTFLANDALRVDLLDDDERPPLRLPS